MLPTCLVLGVGGILESLFPAIRFGPSTHEVPLCEADAIGLPDTSFML